MKRLFLVGAGGHCRAAIEIAESMGVFDETKVIDYNNHTLKEERIQGCEVLCGKQWMDDLNADAIYFVSVGDNRERSRIQNLLSARGLKIGSLQHKSAIIHKSARIGKGVFIGPLAHVGPDCDIGDGCIVNSMANIEHESHIGCFSHCGPGSIVCGRCSIGKKVLLGAHGTIIDGISVADDVVVGAGSVVIRSIAEFGSVNVGVPARRI